MKIVFFGTPDYVIPILGTLNKSFRQGGVSPIAAVVTQEPKLVGREQLKTFSPVDEWAYEKKIPKFFDPIDIVKENIAADIGVLASYGKIISEDVIKHFKYGIINIHPSLLPLWRGSSPIQASIVSGEKITGVTFMKLDRLLDHGPIVSQFKDEILPEDNSLSLRTRLFERAAEAIPSLINAYISGKTKVKPQDHDKATFTKQLKKEDGFIPPEFIAKAMNVESRKKYAEWEIKFVKNCILPATPYMLHNFIRAMDPWPGAWTEIKISSNKDIKRLRLKILKAHIEEKSKIINHKSNVLVIDFVQLEGKSPVSWKQFGQGYPEAIF